MPEIDLRQIDALVAEHVMGLEVGYVLKRALRKEHAWIKVGFKKEPFDDVPGPEGRYVKYRGREYPNTHQIIGVMKDGKERDLECYSSDDSAALRIVPKLNAMGWEVTIIFSADGSVTVNLERFNQENGCTEKTGAGGPSMARTLSLAALRAVGVEVPDHA